MKEKNTDSTLLSDLLKTQSAEDYCNDLAELVFNYASLVDENNIQSFRKDIDTISVLYHTFLKLKKSN